jgi:vacuolar protein sorting-associated protein VTA1
MIRLGLSNLTLILGRRRTAKTFLAASNYFEVLYGIQNEIDESISEKIRYSKWKATDIVKALKMGEVPRPGPPESQIGEDVHDVAVLPSAPTSSVSNIPSPVPHADNCIQGHGIADGPKGNFSTLSASIPVHHSPLIDPPRSSPSVPAQGQQAYTLTCNPQIISQAQKHARYVISALEYDDINTALQNLKQAVALLSPYEKK